VTAPAGTITATMPSPRGTGPGLDVETTGRTPSRSPSQKTLPTTGLASSASSSNLASPGFPRKRNSFTELDAHGTTSDASFGSKTPAAPTQQGAEKQRGGLVSASSSSQLPQTQSIQTQQQQQQQKSIGFTQGGAARSSSSLQPRAQEVH
jgi:hypothetical protein